jgi:hypothetical protein
VSKKQMQNIGDFQFRPPLEGDGIVPDEVFYHRGKCFMHVERLSQTEVWLGIVDERKTGMMFNFFIRDGRLICRAERYETTPATELQSDVSLSREAKIQTLHNQGHSLRQIGKTVGLSYERVRQILAATDLRERVDDKLTART